MKHYNIIKRLSFTNARDKLEGLSVGRSFKRSLMFVGKIRRPPLSGTPERCFSWVGSEVKDHTRTNTPAYYEHYKITEVKSIITIGPGLHLL